MSNAHLTLCLAIIVVPLRPNNVMLNTRIMHNLCIHEVLKFTEHLIHEV